jgi:hypothetical protein
MQIAVRERLDDLFGNLKRQTERCNKAAMPTHQVMVRHLL